MCSNISVNSRGNDMSLFNVSLSLVRISFLFFKKLAEIQTQLMRNASFITNYL